MNKAQIDSFFNASIKDEYDLNATVGKFMNEFKLPMQIKDAIKTAIREAFNLGYQAAKENQC